MTCKSLSDVSVNVNLYVDFLLPGSPVIAASSRRVGDHRVE